MALPERSTDRPKDAPNSDAQDSDARDSDAPDSDAPENDAPENDAPDSDAPENDAPESDAPDSDAPDSDAPTPAVEDGAAEDAADTGSPLPVRGAAADAVVSRILVAERPCGYGQRLVVRFEGLRFVAGRLRADIVVTRGGESRRADACVIADAGGFLCGGPLCRDDGTPDVVHRGVIRCLTGLPVLDAWLDGLLESVERRLRDIIGRREDWLGPTSRPFRPEPVAVDVEGCAGLSVVADELVYDGALHGSLRLRVGCCLAGRSRPGTLVGGDGAFGTVLPRELLGNAPWRLSVGRRGAVRAALRRIEERLVALHRELSGEASAP